VRCDLYWPVRTSWIFSLAEAASFQEIAEAAWRCWWWFVLLFLGGGVSSVSSGRRFFGWRRRPFGGDTDSAEVALHCARRLVAVDGGLCCCFWGETDLALVDAAVFRGR